MADLTPEEKIASVEKQIGMIELGGAAVIICPYCGAHNAEDQTFCCETLMRCMAAVLDRRENQRRAEIKKRIEDTWVNKN